MAVDEIVERDDAVVRHLLSHDVRFGLRTVGRFLGVDAPAEAVSFVFRDELDYQPDMLVARRSSPDEARRLLQAALERMETVPEFSTEALDESLHQLADQLGVRAGTLFTPIRVAATGRLQAPPLFSTLAAIGREGVLRRLRIAIGRLEQSPEN